MSELPGLDKADLKALPLVRDRMTFLYIEHCMIHRQDGAITVTDIRGTVYVPAASLSVLMLGPGTSISHRAVELIGDSGASIIWVGEQGVRYYAHGRPLTRSSNMLVRQAALVSNVRSRIAVARQMYQLRFPYEDVSNYSMQQLRGREGARVRAIYREAAARTGVMWKRRNYDPNDFDASDPVNQALSAAHVCLYGLAHSVIVALGCSPGLGFVHTGHELSFVYDIADLYKAEITIPIAFEVAAQVNKDVGAETRRSVRDALAKGHILERVVRDICYLLHSDDEQETPKPGELIYLWDDRDGLVAHGISYGKEDESFLAETPRIGYGKVLEEKN